MTAEGGERVNSRGRQRATTTCPSDATGRGLWTMAETALWLTVPERMVRRLVAERRIPYVKVGRYVRFRPQDVQEWRDGQVHPVMASERRTLR